MNPTIPQFNNFVKPPPFKFNEVYRDDESNEANLYLQIFLEWTYLHGTDIVFIERQLAKPEEVFGEYIYKTLSKGTPMRLFIEETEVWGGSGDAYQKFGLMVNDEVTFYCPKLLFQQANPDLYPKYGDLIYINKSQKLFEIKHIEDETPPTFYLLGNRNGYKITAKTYSHDHTEIVQDIDPTKAIPDAVLALDKLFDSPITKTPTELQNVEIRRNNIPVEIEGRKVLSNKEKDPLLGG